MIINNVSEFKPTSNDNKQFLYKRYITMPTPFNPSQEIRDFCDHIINSHTQVLRQNKKHKTWYWDYPAVAAICHNNSCTLKKAAHSHYPNNSDKWNPVLRHQMECIGKIGYRLIGNCAEQHAANNYMNNFHENSLNQLYFSEALRPRTKQVIEYCNNCKDIFPNL